MSTKNLLVELFVEELPPKALKKLGESFAATLAASLKAQGLVDDISAATSFASPRRLAAHVTGVAARAADKAVQQKLMPVAVALDAAGQPTPALLKKLAALGTDASVVPSLKRQMDGKAEALFLDSVVPGTTLAAGSLVALEAALSGLPIPKVMSYQLQDGWSSVNFVRPAHKLVALHGADVVPVSVLGLTAGRETQGHRFECDSATVGDVERARLWDFVDVEVGEVCLDRSRLLVHVEVEMVPASREDARTLSVRAVEAIASRLRPLNERSGLALGELQSTAFEFSLGQAPDRDRRRSNTRTSHDHRQKNVRRREYTHRWRRKRYIPEQAARKGRQ